MKIKKRGRYLVFNKSQVSIFMIAAVLVLLLGLFYFYYQKQTEKKIEFVQPELVPIKSYVENCMKNIAEDGLQRIGFSGGYINIPEVISQDYRRYLSSFPQSGLKIPYWWYSGIESVPTEDYIRLQLKNYIKAQLNDCLNNFEQFNSTFEINKLKDPTVDVKFNDEDTSIELDYQLEVIGKYGNFKALLENFRYEVPIRFKKAYELAKLIMQRENNDYFLEKRTIDLYSMDQNIPVTDIGVSCKTKTWLLSNIKDELKKLLRFNLPYIKIEGTDYNPDIYVPNPNGKETYSQSYYQQHYVWRIANDAQKNYKNMKVTFNYENWPLDIFARPSQNGVLKSDSQKGTDLLKFFCLHIWHFTYDISYPVLATIFDKETEKNKQYQFNFAFTVDIDHNQPNRINKGKTLFESIDDVSSESYCSDVQNEITVLTTNNVTGDYINDVNLTFVCGRFYCDMGKTDWLSLGAAAGITKKMPYCVNAVLKANKNGYADSQSFMQTDVDGRSYVLFMNPLKEFNYKIVKHQLSSTAKAEDLTGNEKASIFIKGNETGFDSFVVYPQEGGFPLRLPLGKDVSYDITIYLTNDENLIGGYSGKWKISKDDLQKGNEIVFHTVYQASANEDEMALFLAGLEPYSRNVPAPEFK